jgi:hypothetical protein
MFLVQHRTIQHGHLGIVRTLGVFFLLVLMSLAVGAGVTGYRQLADVKADLAAARRDLAAMKERVARLERVTAEPSGEPTAAPRARDGATSKGLAPAQPPLELTREEVQLVRDYIKLPPPAPGATPAIALGSPVPEQTLLPLPPQIGEKALRLLGARFTTDRNGAIVIVRPGSRRADAIISPN